MIYFITKNNTNYLKTIPNTIFKDIKIINETQGKELYLNFIKGKKIIGLDIEATGLDCHLSTILLLGISYKNTYFIFDNTIDITFIVKDIVKYKRIILGHNLKYDIKLLYTHTNILIKKVFDTMICEQRLYLGMGYNRDKNPTGYLWDYANCVKRYLKIEVLKQVRSEFINIDPSKFVVTPAQIYYLTKDLQYLFPIRKIFMSKIKSLKMQYLIYGIEFPLISVIANAEIRGFNFNQKKWLERVEKDRAKLFELLLSLDKELDKLRKTKKSNNINLINSGKFIKTRKSDELFENLDKVNNTLIGQLDLFGNPMKIEDYIHRKSISKTKPKVKQFPNNLTYTKQEIVWIFGALNEPLIQTDENFSIPQFINIKGKTSLVNFNLYSVEQNYLEKYLIQKPNSLMKDFIEYYLKYKKIEKSINTYGENFIKKINPKTNRLHTIFRQCFADTGRMQSGGGKKEEDKPNFQNIPRDNEYRNCFIATSNEYEIMSNDYDGAELIIMASVAQDDKLIAISKEDMHSFMATKGWKATYNYRYNKLKELYTNNLSKLSDNQKIEIEKQLKELLNLSINYVVDKTTGNKRTEYKPMTFGVIYGMYAKKAGATLNIPKEEGQIHINVIENEIPKTIQAVKNASLFAERNGYLIHNTRTNSRRWFPALIKLLKKVYNKSDNFIEISEALSAARNTFIQGTQADFMKEASVRLQYYYWKRNINANILSWVHDEFVIDFMKQYHNHKFFLSGKEFKGIKDVTTFILEDTANKYLKNINISIAVDINDYWKK